MKDGEKHYDIREAELVFRRIGGDYERQEKQGCEKGRKESRKRLQIIRLSVERIKSDFNALLRNLRKSTVKKTLYSKVFFTMRRKFT